MATTSPMFLDWFLAPFARHFRGLGWTVDSLANADAEFARRADFDRHFVAPWSRNPLRLANLTEAPALVRSVAARGYDIVHVHSPVAAFVTRLGLRRARRAGGPRVIYTAHGFHFHANGAAATNAAFLGLEKLAGRWTDYLVVMNRDDERAALRHRLVPPDRLRLMPGIGVDLERFARAAVAPGEVRRFREEAGLGDAPYLLMAAEFIERKRHRDLLRAFQLLGPGGEGGPLLVLAGTGPLLEEMRSLAGELGIGGRVRFLGFRTDMELLLRDAAGLVLPSAQEGLPRCVLEAMAMGVPVVGSRIRGNVDLLEGGVGHLFDPGDVPALAEALRRVLGDREEAAARARLGEARAADYDLRRLVRMHEELYAEALAAAHPEAPFPLLSGGLPPGAARPSSTR
jgi:glycosyltransferase involved in cell wall biosynthesis